MMRLRQASILSCTVALSCFVSVSALAHRASTGGNESGLAILGLSHGQMAVIADYRGDVLALAERQNITDETFRRLLNFGKIQFTYCLWGLVPASLRDENSPFNECSHAYLSAIHALLLHMRSMEGDTGTVDALISRIDANMVRKRASFVQCQFSGETFNTAEIVSPMWRDVPSHPPSLIAFGLVALSLTAGGIGLRGKRPA